LQLAFKGRPKPRVHTDLVEIDGKQYLRSFSVDDGSRVTSRHYFYTHESLGGHAESLRSATIEELRSVLKYAPMMSG
jgi:hypothetical protein